MEILTGNELTSGGTVYLDAHNTWVEDLQAARIFSKDDVAERDGALSSGSNAVRTNAIVTGTAATSAEATMRCTVPMISRTLITGRSAR